jgi:hypothetical protein
MDLLMEDFTQKINKIKLHYIHLTFISPFSLMKIHLSDSYETKIFTTNQAHSFLKLNYGNILKTLH